MSREEQYLLLNFFLGILVIAANGRSWDIAVAIKSKIDLYAENRTYLGEKEIPKIIELTGLAYDNTTNMMYVSGNETILSVSMNDLRTETNSTSIPVVRKKGKTYISGIAFDASTRTLFWTDTFKDVIMKTHITKYGEPKGAAVLHDLRHRSPWGITLDLCNSHMYWINSNKTNRSIERSNLDGKERTIVIKEGLTDPVAVTVDHLEQKLYWVDDTGGDSFAIERSDLDGNARELVIKDNYHKPLFLAVDANYMYWSERVHRTVWRAPKSGRVSDRTKFVSYFEKFDDTDPQSVITRDNVDEVDCAAVAAKAVAVKSSKHPTTLPVPLPATSEIYNNLTVSTEKSDLTTESSGYCLNDGQWDKNSGTCRCKLGFFGPHCETSLCYNYCLRGDCIINNSGSPECKCASAYRGARCEKDVCDGYCLHNGQCSVQYGKPSCKCIYSTGIRCEFLENITKKCATFCANGQTDEATIDTRACRCANDINQTAERMVVTPSDNFEYGTLLLILAAIIAVLILVIAVLSYYVTKLRRRPRIKKRVVVLNKGGTTPLTSRPQIPDNQCEITIENCCNMNICETPCFEPKLRTVVPGSTNFKKEEKNSLLDNMDG